MGSVGHVFLFLFKPQIYAFDELDPGGRVERGPPAPFEEHAHVRLANVESSCDVVRVQLLGIHNLLHLIDQPVLELGIVCGISPDCFGRGGRLASLFGAETNGVLDRKARQIRVERRQA